MEVNEYHIFNFRMYVNNPNVYVQMAWIGPLMEAKNLLIYIIFLFENHISFFFKCSHYVNSQVPFVCSPLSLLTPTGWS